ncbi:MAG: MFS transporter [Oscillospiraceae bacterium]|nr:MFS transporter [Oscillospiraceae bacterium]
MSQSFYAKLDPANKYILFCCFFMFATNGLYGMVLGSLLPLISAEYGLSNTISGALLSSHQIGALIAGFSAGILPLYLGRKKALLFLCTFVIVGFTIVIITGNPVWLIIGFLFTGISRGSISNFNNAIVNEVSNGSAAALNLLHSVFAIGALSAPFLVIWSTNLMGDEGWKLAVLIIIGFVTAAILFFSRAKIAESTKEQRKEKLSYQFLRNRWLWYNIGILFFYLCVEATVNGWIVTYFVNTDIMSRQYAQMLASLLWLVILAGRLSVAFSRDRIPKQWILIGTSIGTALFYILLLATRNLTVITIAIAGLGFSMAAIYPTTIANISKTIKTHPQSLGVILLTSGVGAISMPLITGILSDRFGLVAGMGAVIVAISLMLLCVILAITGRPNEPEQAK